jgi:cytochrome c-type biogenesis protein CcmF
LTWPIAAAAFTAAGLFALGGPIGGLPFVALSLAAGLAVASVAPLWGRNSRRTPLFTYGMVLAHLGIAVSIAGMASDAAFTAERLVAARVGEPILVGPYTVTLDGVTPRVGDNWTALEGRLSIVRDGAADMLRPQTRFFSNPATTTSESAILTTGDGQLYAVLGQPDGRGRWQLRLWWKPYVTFIWLGGALIALGGLMSLVGRVRRERRAMVRMAWA